MKWSGEISCAIFFAADFPDKDGSNLVYDSVIGCMFVCHSEDSYEGNLITKSSRINLYYCITELEHQNEMRVLSFYLLASLMFPH